MARFSTYAEVLMPDHIQWEAYTSGIKKNPPGVLLSDILEHTGGIYENRLDLEPEFRESVRKVAELAGDESLMRIANLSAVVISLEHLRNIDPQTRIVCGYRLDYTSEESERLGLGHQGSYDPKKTIRVSVNPSNTNLVDRD
jgi:hypothetical protein